MLPFYLYEVVILKNYNFNYFYLKYVNELKNVISVEVLVQKVFVAGEVVTYQLLGLIIIAGNFCTLCFFFFNITFTNNKLCYTKVCISIYLTCSACNQYEQGLLIKAEN